MDVSVEERGIEVFEAPNVGDLVSAWRRRGWGCEQGQGNIQMASKSGMGTGMHMTLWSNQRSISAQYDRNRPQEKRVGPSGPRIAG